MRLSKLFLSLCLLGCGSSASVTPGGSAGNGSTLVTFAEPSGLQITMSSGLGTLQKLLVGRFTDDAYPDLLVLTSTSIVLYANTQGSNFTETNTGLSGNFTQGVAVDVSGDNLLDLIVFDTAADEVKLLINNGSNSFTQNASQGSLGSIAELAFASSGQNGVVFIASDSATSHFSLTLNSQSFSDYTNRNDIVTAAAGVVASDFLDSGTPALILVPSSASSDIQFYKQASDFSLTRSTTLARTGSSSVNDAVAANLSGSSADDLILATSNGLELYTNASENGSFNFSLNQSLDVEIDANELLIYDFSGDGVPDFFMSRRGENSVYFAGTGNLAYSETTNTSFGESSLQDSATSLAYEDFDSDGSMDIAQGFSDGSISVHINLIELD